MTATTQPAGSAAPAADANLPTVGHWIDGKAWHGDVARTGPVYDPATGRVAKRVALGGKVEVDAAVAAATRALPGWSETSLVKRVRILFAFRQLLDARVEDLAAVVSAEHGKVPSDAAGEVARGLEVVDFACGIPHLLKGEFSEQVSSGVDAWSIRQPVGVVAGITPFNFPAMVPLWMVPIALACGNTFVLKPSEKDPSSANFLAELLAEAGLPAGVFNVVHGDRESVDALLDHPDIAAISSVTSTPVARHIYETGTARGKRVQALGGAKNHMVVMPDAELDIAADAVVGAAYGSAGQRCMAISALVTVGEETGDKLRAKIEERIAKLHIGPATDSAAEMGPLVTGESRDRVVQLIGEGVEQGADLAVDGRGLKVEGCDEGFFVGPTLFDHVGTDMSVYTEEIFGPVLVMLRAATYDDALALVNSSPYANGTAIFTNDGAVARRFQHDAQVGMVGINVPIPVPMAFFSFGGWKSSLFGDTHMHGTEGIRFYTRLKAITGRWPEPTGERGVNLGFPQN